MIYLHSSSLSTQMCIVFVCLVIQESRAVAGKPIDATVIFQDGGRLAAAILYFIESNKK